VPTPAEPDGGASQQLITWTSSVGATVVGVELVGVELVGAEEKGAAEVGVEVVGVEVAGAELTGAEVAGALLVGARLIGASVDGGDEVGAALRDAVGTVEVQQVARPDALKPQIGHSIGFQAHQSAPDQHGHLVERITRRVGSGAERCAARGKCTSNSRR
jgi:hypothetical protein